MAGKDMSDIVEHLRRQSSQQDMLACEDMLQAADEIERLQALRRAQGDTVKHLEEQNERLVAEIERLLLSREGHRDELDSMGRTNFENEKTIEALELEIERLREHAKIYMGRDPEEILDSYKWMKDEIERLRAENETLRAIEAGMGAVEDEIERLRAALLLYYHSPCPICGGDCSGANPPVLVCPPLEARRALEEKTA
jgi:chromosome segregation ATPase